MSCIRYYGGLSLTSLPGRSPSEETVLPRRLRVIAQIEQDEARMTLQKSSLKEEKNEQDRIASITSLWQRTSV
jgi:hypothetical protein